MINTRRIYKERCKHWQIDDEDIELSELTYKHQPTMVFYAKEADSSYKTSIADNGIINIDQDNTVIESQDDLSIISVRDVIEYNEELWIVENIRNKKYNKTTEYNRRASKIWWLTIRKA